MRSYQSTGLRNVNDGADHFFNLDTPDPMQDCALQCCQTVSKSCPREELMKEVQQASNIQDPIIPRVLGGFEVFKGMVHILLRLYL